MSAETDWLAMLENATSYAELQAAFERMSAASMSTEGGDAMVASIDEAIRRIERERARDQQELDGLSADYESFKQEQSGVIGWFKRKLPFTETRRQELGHRDALSDQAAEILADNFIIARAQLLKERIAPEQARRVGYRPEYWRNQFRLAESVETISEYGKVIFELGRQLVTAKQFMDAVTSDIDGFSAAKFVSKEDQLRCTQDLNAARSELKALAEEIQAKSNLRQAALVTLKSLLIAELSEKDRGFKETHQRCAELEGLLEKHPGLAKLLDERSAIAKEIIAKLTELDALPEQREKLEKSAKTLQQEYDQAERSRLRAAQEFEEPSRLYNAAVQEAHEAKLALNATRPLYDAYMAEQATAAAGTAEVASESDFGEVTSNVVAEYRRLEGAMSQATQLVTQRKPTFEQAKLSHERAVNDAKSLRDKLDSQTRELQKLDELESELQKQWSKARQNLELTLSSFRVAADSFVAEARKLSWWAPAAASTRAIHDLLGDSFAAEPPRYSSTSSSSMSTSMFQQRTSPHSTLRQQVVAAQQSAELLEKATRQIAQTQQGAKTELGNLSRLRTEAIRTRGQLLLEQSVLSELDLE